MKIREIAERKLAQFRSSQKLSKKIKELEEELSIFTEGMKDPLRAAYKRASELNKELSQAQLHYCLSITLDDGCQFILDDSYAMEYKGKWLFVFTKSHGIRVFPLEEVLYFRQFERAASIEAIL